MAYTTINKSSDYFNTKLYTGNATNPTTISGIGFQPDLVWTKLRAGGTEGHRLCDAVRGVTKDLFSNDSDAEATNSIGLKSFNSDGYVIGNSNGYNINSGTFVSWNWKAGTAFTNDASATGIGSIDSTGSFNNDSGFSIVSYTGTGSNGTIKHGLNTAPSMIIFKNRSSVKGWSVYHKSIGATKFLFLNETSAEQTYTPMFNNTEPTSSVFSVGTDLATNVSGNNYIAYCFAEKQGYSKFGSYTGNGNADGTFVYTGFKPAWVLIKRSSAAGDQWQLSDNKRGINGAIKTLYPDSTEVETSGDSIDFLSNGFKNKSSSVARNGSGSTYIYMAFAEAPLVGSNNIPATAR